MRPLMTNESDRTLSDKLDELEALPWAAVKRLVGHQVYAESVAESGAKYATELNAMWDDKSRTVVRLIVDLVGRYEREEGWIKGLGTAEILVDEHGARRL